jgi:hypothetical protein
MVGYAMRFARSGDRLWEVLTRRRACRDALARRSLHTLFQPHVFLSQCDSASMRDDDEVSLSMIATT